MFKFKKGTEKPIEIFVALFIILAVALVMLKMFKGQVQEKSSEMKDIERASELEQDLSDARLLCQNLCTTANQDECSPRSKANFCTRKLQPIDLNGDMAMDGRDNSILGGIGVCEDAIYCPLLTECACAEDLTMSNCIDLLCNYWNESGIYLNNDLNTTLGNTYGFGSCDTSAPFWNISVGTFNCADYIS